MYKPRGHDVMLAKFVHEVDLAETAHIGGIQRNPPKNPMLDAGNSPREWN